MSPLAFYTSLAFDIHIPYGYSHFSSTYYLPEGTQLKRHTFLHSGQGCGVRVLWRPLISFLEIGDIVED